MNEPTNPEPAPDHDPLRLRHVLTIVLVGAALGVGFNSLQLSAGSSRALAWVKSERRVVSLVGVPRTSPEAAAPVAPGPRVPAARSAPPPAAAGAATADTTHRNAAPARGAVGKPTAHDAPKSGTPAKAIPPATAPTMAPAPARAPAPPAASSTSVPADLPVIPDSRDPAEAGIDVVQKLHAAGAALFLDARSADEYAGGHIAGAINLPFDDVYKNPALAKAVDARGRVLVTYCGGGECDLSRNLAFSLIDAGFRKVLVFTGGMPAWTAAGRTVHKGAQP